MIPVPLPTCLAGIAAVHRGLGRPSSSLFQQPAKQAQCAAAAAASPTTVGRQEGETLVSCLPLQACWQRGGGALGCWSPGSSRTSCVVERTCGEEDPQQWPLPSSPLTAPLYTAPLRLQEKANALLPAHLEWLWLWREVAVAADGGREGAPGAAASLLALWRGLSWGDGSGAGTACKCFAAEPPPQCMPVLSQVDAEAFQGRQACGGLRPTAPRGQELR